MADTFTFDPTQRQNFDKWMASDDVTPQGLYQALGVSPGFGKYRSREELDPTFLDKLLDKFGVQTDRTKELKELAAKQEALKPFAQQVLATKVADQVHRNAIERNLPQTTADLTPAVAKTLGFGDPQAMTAQAGPLAPPTGLQPAPQQQVFGQDQPPMMLRPAPSLGDQALAGMPLGTPGQVAAMSQVQPFTDPNTAPGVFSQFSPDAMAIPPTEQAGFQPVMDPSTGGPIPFVNGAPIPGDATRMTARVMDQPITMADRKQIPQPAPPAAARPLTRQEKLLAAGMLNSQATAHLMPDETGKLVPSSFLLPEAKSLSGEQQESLRRVMNGEPPLPGVSLPPAQFVAALKGRQEAKVGSMPEIVKLQNQADQLPEGSRRRLELEDRIQRLSTESKSAIGEVAAAQAEFAALPPELQTSQNASLIAGRHKNVLTEDIMKGIKNPNQPLVNINTGVSASEEAAKQFMASTKATFDQLKSAPTALRNIEEAKRLIPAAKGFMGPGGETLLEAAKFLNSRIGTKIDTAGVKSAEELRTRIFFNIMDNLKKMDAQPSQFQQQIMMDSLGKLGTDPNALANVLDAFADTIRGKVEQHNSEVESAGSRNVKFPYNPIIKLPPRQAKPEASTGPARIQGDDDYNKLPSGATFIAPDGTTRRKP